MRQFRTRILLSSGVLALLGACSTVSSITGSGTAYPVFFEAWSASLDASGHDAIDNAAAYAKSHPGLPVVVSGYAGPDGSAQANVDISRLRAQVVTDELVKDGVAADRISRKAEGAEAFTQNATESRRVTITVGSP